MKTYMNAQEKQDFIMMCALLGYTHGIIEDWDRNITKEEKKNIKTAKTFMTKFTDSVMARMDKNFSKQLHRIALDSQIFCLPKERADIKIKQSLKNKEKFISVDLEALEQLAEMALGKCDPCREPDHTECKLKKLFIELNIDPIEFDADGCGYLQSKW